MHGSNSRPEEEAHSRYRAIEASSLGSSLALVAVCSAVIYLLNPPRWFVVTNLFAGVLVFLAWQAALRARTGIAAAISVAAAALAFQATAPYLARPISAISALGLGLLGLGFLSSVAVYRKFGRRRPSGVQSERNTNERE